MKKIKKQEKKYILINLYIFRCHILISWEPDPDKIINWASKNGVEIDDKWVLEFKEHKEDVLGICMALGNSKNKDILVWIKERPIKASQFGILYHELHHAVGQIAKDHSMEDERESQAYIFEYLANECNQFLWK